MNRISKISKTAMKQTKKSKLPIINPLLNLKDFVDKSIGNTFICHLNKNIKEDLFNYKNKILKNRQSCILIGPEGDFTKEEVVLALKNNFFEVSLGDSILRTETAGVVACNLINQISNEK